MTPGDVRGASAHAATPARYGLPPPPRAPVATPSVGLRMLPGVPPAQPRSTSNATTLRVSRLNSTATRCIGSPRPRYFSA